MAKMKGGGAAIKGTNYPKGAPRYAKGGSVARGMGCTSKGGNYVIR